MRSSAVLFALLLAFVPLGSTGAQMAPRIRRSTARVGPAYSPEQVRRVIRRHQPEIRTCYEEALRGERALEGELVLRWTIDAEGRVRDLRVRESSLEAPGLQRCVLSVLRRCRFPRPTAGGSLHIVYPFRFSPPEESRAAPRTTEGSVP